MCYVPKTPAGAASGQMRMLRVYGEEDFAGFPITRTKTLELLEPTETYQGKPREDGMEYLSKTDRC